MIFTGLRLSYGETNIPAENIDAVFVADTSIAYDMGLRTGDRLLAVNGEPLERYEDFESIESLIADPFTVTVLRGSDTLLVRGPEDIFTQINRRGPRLGVYIAPAVIGAVMQDTPADSIGLQAGDRIVSIAGDEIRFWAEMTEYIRRTEGNPVIVRWQRPDSTGVDAFPVYEALVAPALREEGYLLGVYRPGADILAEEFGAVQRRFFAIRSAGRRNWRYLDQHAGYCSEPGAHFHGSGESSGKPRGADHDRTGYQSGYRSRCCALLGYCSHAFHYTGHYQHSAHSGARRGPSGFSDVRRGYSEGTVLAISHDYTAGRYVSATCLHGIPCL